MTEHTKTPWAVFEGQRPGIEAENFSIVTFGDDELDSDCGIHGNSIAEGKANAEFIVTACNAHDDLVAALKLAEQAIFSASRQLMDIAGIDEDETIVEELEQIRGALASVES